MNYQTDEQKPLLIEELQLKKSALVLRAINHKLRQQILKVIHIHGRMTVTEIYAQLKLEQSVASQHLAVLRKTGYVHTVRDGKFIYYSLNYPKITLVQEIIQTLLK